VVALLIAVGVLIALGVASLPWHAAVASVPVGLFVGLVIAVLFAFTTLGLIGDALMVCPALGVGIKAGSVGIRTLLTRRARA
jgi:hypothetical protein